MKSAYHRNSSVFISIIRLFTIGKIGNQHRANLRGTDKENGICICSGVLCSHEEELNPVIYSKISRTERYYVKPDTRRQVLYILSCIEVL